MLRFLHYTATAKAVDRLFPGAVLPLFFSCGYNCIFICIKSVNAIMFGSFCGRPNPPPTEINSALWPLHNSPRAFSLSLSLSVAAYCSAGVVRVQLSRTISLFSQSDFRGSRHLLGALIVKIFSSLLRNTCSELTHLSSAAGVGGFRSLWGPAPEFFDVTRRADIIHRLCTSRMTATETEQENRLKLSPLIYI